MESRTESLLVRQHERVSCDLRAKVSPSSEHQSRVRLTRTLGDGSGNVSATVTDCSPGGLGILSPVFFPKTSVLSICILGEDGAPAYEGSAQVQRVVMHSRQPMYYIGVAFVIRPGPEQFSRMMEVAARSTGSAPVAKGDTGA